MAARTVRFANSSFQTNTADVIIKCDGVTFHVHSVMIAKNSTWCSQCAGGTEQITTKTKIEIDGCADAAIGCMFNFMCHDDYFWRDMHLLCNKRMNIASPGFGGTSFANDDAAWLLAHINVFRLAELYRVPELLELAVEKFEETVQDVSISGMLKVVRAMFCSGGSNLGLMHFAVLRKALARATEIIEDYDCRRELLTGGDLAGFICLFIRLASEQSRKAAEEAAKGAKGAAALSGAAQADCKIWEQTIEVKDQTIVDLELELEVTEKESLMAMDRARRAATLCHRHEADIKALETQLKRATEAAQTARERQQGANAELLAAQGESYRLQSELRIANSATRSIEQDLRLYIAEKQAADRSDKRYLQEKAQREKAQSSSGINYDNYSKEYDQLSGLVKNFNGCRKCKNCGKGIEFIELDDRTKQRDRRYMIRCGTCDSKHYGAKLS